MKDAALRKALLIIECNLHRAELAGQLAETRAAAAASPGTPERLLLVVTALESVLACVTPLRRRQVEAAGSLLPRLQTALLGMRVALTLWGAFRRAPVPPPQ